MIDTFLAKVTYVADMTYDAQGHLKTPATITLEAYDAANGGYTALTLTDSDANYGYAKGDYVLLNAYTADNSAVASGKVINNTNKYAEIVSKATSVDGAQSVIYWNAKQHNVEGTVYDDAFKFMLDEAKQKDAKYTWYFDSYNNLIGAVEIAAANSYGVINSIWWAGNAADGSGVAKANVTYMDGTTALVDLSEMTYKDASSVLKTGTVSHSTATSSVMTADGTYFYVDSYINTNTNNDGNKLLNGHLFRFTTKSNGTLKAVEVDNYVAADNVADSGKLHNLADVAVSKNTQVYGGATGALVVNSNTVFLVRSGAGTTANPYTFKSIVGFTNIDNYVAGEVDYVDLNGDNVADYVYVIAPSATSKVTSLFYFDGQQGAYTLADGTWVVKGYVDGVAGEVKFADYAALNTVLGAAPAANTLYIVALEDGVVKQGHAVTAGETLDAEIVVSDSYKLAAAYDSYNGKTIKIDAVVGAAGTSAASYADRDTFADSLYHDYDVNKYYSVVADLTKVVGTMGNPADQNYYFVSIQNGGALNALALQVYAYDKVTSPSNPDPAAEVGTVTYTLTLVNKDSGAQISQYTKTVNNVAVGTHSVTLAEMAQLVGVSTDKLVAFGPSSIEFTVAKGATVTPTLSAYYAN